MAMEGDRNARNLNRSTQNYSRLRIDARHTRENVPVLFRLKNLQRVDVAQPEQDPAVAQSSFDPTNAPPTFGQRAPQPRNEAVSQDSLSRAAPTRSPNAAPSTSRIDAAHAELSSDTGSSASAAPKKPLISRGMILLAVAVVAAFGIGRLGRDASTSPSKEEIPVAVTTIEPPANLASANNTASIPVSTTANTDLQLVAPKLPEIDSENAWSNSSTPPQGSLEVLSAKEKPASDQAFAAKTDAEPILLDAKTKAEPSSPVVDVPATLTADSTNVTKPEPAATTGDKGDFDMVSVASQFPKSESTNNTKETTSPKPTAPASPVESQLVATSTPSTDFRQLMEIRNQFLNQEAQRSQMAALNLAQSQSASAQTVASPNLAATSSMSQPQNSVPSSISAQTVGFGGATANATQNSQWMPNNAAITNPWAASNSMPQMSSPVNPWSANAPTSNANTTTAPGSQFVQPVNQPYQPMYAAPNNAMPASQYPTAPANANPNFAVPPATGNGYQPIGSSLSPDVYGL